MKKVIVSVLTAAILLALMSTAVCGAESSTVNEVPDIKIIVEGTLTGYKNVPVSIAGNTMLPLRELLVVLGVPNDDDHIKYNSGEKSVTIIYEQTRILLYIGKKEAYVNDKLVSLNAAPILYKNYTYVPVRFVAETLDKKVVWDAASRSVLICDFERFKAVEQIMEMSRQAALKAGKYKIDTSVDAVYTLGPVKESIGINAQTAVDKTDKKMYMSMLFKMPGLEFETASYYSANAAYTRNPLSGGWQKAVYPDDEYDKLFESQSNTNAINVKDTLCAGLSLSESENDNELVLSGDVYMADLYESALAQQNGLLQADDVKLPVFDTFSLRLVLDKNTYLMKSLTMLVNSEEDRDRMKVASDIGVEMQYSEYDGTFEVTVPAYVLENAVESSTVSGSTF